MKPLTIKSTAFYDVNLATVPNVPNSGYNSESMLEKTPNMAWWKKQKNERYRAAMSS